MHNSERQEEFDYHRLEAEKEMSKAMLDANMAEFEAEKKAKAMVEQEEREQLIAEAYKVAGRIEAFNFVSNFADIGSFTLLKKIKESKVYKEMPTIKTWDNFCKSIGLSRSKVDEDLENISIFGENFIADVRNFGLGYRELRALRKQAKEGNIEVLDAEVVIDGEVIPVDDKDTLREALDCLLEDKYKKIAELKKENKEKDEEIKQLQNANALFLQDRQKAVDELEYIKGIGVFNGIEVEENPDFARVREIEDKVNILDMYLNKMIEDKDTLSPANKRFLGGVVIKAMCMLDEVHQKMVHYECQSWYGEAFYWDDVLRAEGKIETPIEYQKRIEIETEEEEEKEVKVVKKASNE